MGWSRSAILEAPERGPANRPKTAEIAFLVVLLLAGAAVRFLYLREARLDPSFRHPAIDAGYNDDWARSIAVPEWKRAEQLPDPEIGSRPYLRPPGYPWFLAATYAVSGGAYEAPRVAQILLGLASIFLAWRIGRRIAGPAAGLVFAALVAFHVSLVYWEAELHEPTLLVFLLLAAVVALARFGEAPSVRRAALAGALLGLGALVRPNVLLLLAFAAAWTAWVARGRGVRALPAAAGLLAAAAVVISPATIRNALVARDLVLITSNSGINLFIGNNPKATGFVSGTLPGYGDFRTCYDYPAIARKVERELGRPVSDSEISAHFTRKAIAFVRERPGQFLSLLGKKALLFWGPDEVSHNKVEALDRENSPCCDACREGSRRFSRVRSSGSRSSDGRAGTGWRRAHRPLREISVLVAGFTLAWFLSVLPYFAAERYRAPILPFLMLLASVAAVKIASLLFARRPGAAAAWAGAFALLLAIASVRVFPLEKNVAKWHMDRGRAFGRDGRPDLALAEFEKVLADEPDAPDANFSAAVALGALGRVDEAIEHYRLALAGRPNDADALNNLGSLLAQRGRLGEAIEVLERAVRAGPEQPRNHVNLGHALVVARRPAEAMQCFREALRLDPGNALARRGIAEATRMETGGASPPAVRR